MKPPTTETGTLPAMASALAVVAHPDNEFGLGGVLAALHAMGTKVAVVCFTHGEASTLGAELLDGDDLHAVRTAELAQASRALGLEDVELYDYPDGQLCAVPVDELADQVEAAALRHNSDLLVVFDEGGVTGHPDHSHATRVALATAERLDRPVLAWAVTKTVADKLNAEFGTRFVGRPDSNVDLFIEVDRNSQLAAIACHRSQSAANPVLWRRLDLTGDREPLRLLRARNSQPGRSG
jgi:N-acetylglucosamine malate deacetylase 2